jgi:Small subunit of acetolactate synthase
MRRPVLDAAERTVTLSVTGDAGKVMALQLKLAKFGIVELVRTGKIALKRGQQLLEMGGWGDSALRRRRRQRQKQVGARWMRKMRAPPISRRHGCVLKRLSVGGHCGCCTCPLLDVGKDVRRPWLYLPACTCAGGRRCWVSSARRQSLKRGGGRRVHGGRGGGARRVGGDHSHTEVMLMQCLSYKAQANVLLLCIWAHL